MYMCSECVWAFCECQLSDGLIIGDAKQVWKSSPVESRLTKPAAMALMVNDRIQVEQEK